MDIIKKIAIVIAMVLNTIVRIPVTIIAAVLAKLDMFQIRVFVWLTKKLDCDVWTDVIRERQELNAEGMENIAKYFYDLAEDLAE